MSHPMGVWHTPVNQFELTKSISNASSPELKNERETELQEQLKKSYEHLEYVKKLGENTKDAELALRLHNATQGDTLENRVAAARQDHIESALIDTRLRTMRPQSGQTQQEFYSEVKNWQADAQRVIEQARAEAKTKVTAEVTPPWQKAINDIGKDLF